VAVFITAAAVGLLAVDPFERAAPAPRSQANPKPTASQPTAARHTAKPTAAKPTAPGDPTVRRRILLGRSVEGRPIYAVELGDPDNERRTLAVGVIHGNETAGLSVTRDLANRSPPREALVWVINKLNPDGVAAGTRQNADGVDLNRNFPYRWRLLGAPGDLQYSGPGPLSEPETRIARRLILRLRPQTTVWFHQPLGLVDESGGDLRVERRFARLAGLPLRRLTRYPGSAAGWQNHRLPRTTAFVVELPAGNPSVRRASRYADAVLSIAS
jgi:protein MpaA